MSAGSAVSVKMPFFCIFSFSLGAEKDFGLKDNSYADLYPDTQSSPFSCHVPFLVFHFSHFPTYLLNAHSLPM